MKPDREREPNRARAGNGTRAGNGHRTGNENRTGNVPEPDRKREEPGLGTGTGPGTRAGLVTCRDQIGTGMNPDREREPNRNRGCAGRVPAHVRAAVGPGPVFRRKEIRIFRNALL